MNIYNKKAINENGLHIFFMKLEVLHKFNVVTLYFKKKSNETIRLSGVLWYNLMKLALVL